jgi:Tfp pilus assembly protein PilX
MRNQEGIALPVTLVMVMVLMALTVTLMTLSSFEPAISRNLADGTQARFAAEAGIEWAYNTVAATPNWSTLLVGAPATGLNMTSNATLPGLPASRGTFTVGVRNDSTAGDTAHTGLSPIDATHTDDTNGALIITSVGTTGTGSKTLQVAIMKAVAPPFPAALAFPGNEAEVSFGSGDSFQISGYGYNTDGTLDPGCATVSGIAVSSILPTTNPGGNEGVVESSLSSAQKDNVKGKKESTSGVDYGNNTIDVNGALTPEATKAFIDKAKAAATVNIDSSIANPAVFNGQSWGTPTNPEVVYVKGEPDPTSAFAAATINGPTVGYGILIVEDGDLRINGDFKWYGPIIVTGNWVGVGFLGGGTQEVYGAVISNETATDPGFREGVVTGAAKIRYSCDALDAAVGMKKLITVSNWKER